MPKPLPLEELPVYSKSNPISPERDFLSGAVVLVNKPKDWTSFDAVKYIRNRIGIKKVGHAGTLDPMATGLLVLCTGKATKSIDQIQSMPKAYHAEITFGHSTPSYDAMSEADAHAKVEHITESMIADQLNHHFLGEIDQVPPMYSALKRDGKKLYELARRGKIIELEPRPVTIYEHNIVGWTSPVLELTIRCGKGTYIRSLAHDLGKAVGSLAHLSALERTEIGHFVAEEGYTPHEINDIMRTDG
ncbi:MAG: tRNA pseudouridine(55) synthase TruB [Bacteroidota bacterium]